MGSFKNKIKHYYRESPRSYLALVTGSSLNTLELTVGSESNIQLSSDRKKANYHSSMSDFNLTFPNINFINLLMSTLEILGKSSDSLLLLQEDLKLDEYISKFTIKTIINIAIRRIYCECCLRNKPWIHSV